MALTLATVETAIEGLLASGQSFTVAGITYQQASLTPLMNLRKQLKRESGSRYGFAIRPMNPPEH